MTLEEVTAAIQRAKAHGNSAVLLSIDRLPRGERMRVLPGVMGTVASVSNDGRTNCWVPVADLDRAMAKARKEAEVAS